MSESSSIRSADKTASKTEIGASLKQSTPPEGLVFEDVYTITKRLRAGSYGTVFCTRHISSSQEVAVKILDRTKLKKKDDDAVFREVAVMKELIDVPGVIKLLDFFVSPEKFYVVQEWAEGGDVRRFLPDCEHQSRSFAHPTTTYTFTRLFFSHRSLISCRNEQLIQKRMLGNCPFSCWKQWTPCTRGI